MNPKARIVARYQSRSRPGTVYEVKQDEQGNLFCSCPGWIHKGGGWRGWRSCRHVEDAARRVGEPE